jgi:hypothetical protein
MTKKEFLSAVAYFLDGTTTPTDEQKEALRTFALKEMELLEKRAERETAVRKSKQAQKALADYAEAEKLEAVLTDEYQTLAQVKEAAGMADMSTQKVVALMKKLVDGGKAEKTVVKKKTYYRLAKGE